MSVPDIYAPEGQLADAIKAILADNVTALSRSDPVTYQKDRPRVEVLAILGAGNSRKLVKSEDSGLECDTEDAWDCDVWCEVIVEPGDPQPPVDTLLRSYVAQVRYIMYRLPGIINDGVKLPFHWVAGPIHRTGGVPRFRTEDGFWAQREQFSMILGVHQTAWAKLNT